MKQLTLQVTVVSNLEISELFDDSWGSGWERNGAAAEFCRPRLI